jgi:hypothetical protein
MQLMENSLVLKFKKTVDINISCAWYRSDISITLLFVNLIELGINRVADSN